MRAPAGCRRSVLSPAARKFAVAVAARHVVVYQAGGLHECVANRRPDEAKAPSLEILAHRLRLRGLRREVAKRAPAADDRRSADELPDVYVEASKRLADLEDLPTRQRRALVMHELEDRSHSQIGRVLKVSRGASKALVHRARGSLSDHSDRLCRS